MRLNMPDSDKLRCEQCGAPLGRHTREGLCSRCIARFCLLEPEVGEREPVTSDPLSVISAEGGGRTPKTGFGDYELLEEIAHGGMGVVYRARQKSLNRIVAVKMVLFGQFAGKTAFDRFRAEAQTVARLQHPNIVAIHEIGETDGQPYFSMDYVAGRNLADLVRDRPLLARQAAGYVCKIAQAVQYAHTQGVLHRDLKPANVLIDESDEPRITDFGLARQMAGDSELTLTGQVIGSPNFMPPEQGAGKQVKLGPASDVYGLGAVLYCLLTARPPFVAETFEATLAQVLNTEPVAPRQLNPGIPRDLETLCLKCLEKDPERRCASAGELADELDRFLKGEPIHARPIGPADKLWRWCRRKPVVAALTGAVIASLLTVTVVSLTAARRIAAEARHAEQHSRELRLNLYVADMNLAHHSSVANSLGGVRQIISQYLPEAQGIQDGTAKQGVAGQQEDFRGWEWRYLWRLCKDDSLWILRGHSNSVSCAAFSPDGKTLVTASLDQTVRIWDVATRKTLRQLTGFASPLHRNSVAFSPDGGALAVADGTDIHVFETTSWSKLSTLPNQTPVGSQYSLPIAFSPDGKTLSCNAETEIRHWDTSSWERRTSQPANLVGEFGRLLAYSPDGRHFATAKDNGIVVWATSSNPPRQRFSGRLRRPACVTFSQDGRLAAAVGAQDSAIVWDVEEGKEMLQLPLSSSSRMSVAFSPEGRRLVTGDGQIIRLWDIPQGRLVGTLKATYGGINALGFSPDGRTFVSASGDGKARLWSAQPETAPQSVLTAGDPLCFTADSKILALFSTNSSVEYWDVPSGNRVSSFKIPVPVGQRDRVAASPNGGLVAHLSTDGMARVWDRGTGEQIAQLMLDPPPKRPAAAFSPDSRLLAISCDTRGRGGGGWTMVWDFRRGERRTLPGADVYQPSFSPKGNILATGFGNDVQLWSVPDLKPLATLPGHKWTIDGLAFSPDGALLASMGRQSDIRLWDVTTGRLRRLFSGKPGNGGLRHAAFSPDGRTLAAGIGASLALWNVATGKVVLPIGSEKLYLIGPMFSPDGNTLVIGGAQGMPTLEPVELLRAPSLEQIEAAEKAETGSP